jgi:hypothetical protein
MSPLSLENLSQTSQPIQKPTAEAVLGWLLRNIQAGNAPTSEQLELHTHIRQLLESDDHTVKQSAKTLLEKQISDITEVEGYKKADIQKILNETSKELAQLRTNRELSLGGNLGPVVARLFQYKTPFVETTQYDEFLDMLRAIDSLQTQGRVLPTDPAQAKALWKQLGHDGQGFFDEAELKEIQAFYTHIKQNNLFARVSLVVRECKTGSDLLGASFRYDQAKIDAGTQIAGTQIANGKIEKIGDRKDALNMLFDGTNLPWNTRIARDILTRQTSPLDIAQLFERITGEKGVTPQILGQNPEKALIFQQALSQKIELITLLSKLSLIKEKSTPNLQGTTGLTTVLTGGFDAKIEELTQKIDMRSIDTNLASLPPVEKNALLAQSMRWGIPLLVGILTKGVLVTSYDATSTSNWANFTDISTRYGENTPIGQVLNNIITGKTFTFEWGAKNQIENYTRSVRAELERFTSYINGDCTPLPANLSPEQTSLFTGYKAQFDNLIRQGMSQEEAQSVLKQSFFTAIERDVATRHQGQDWSFRLGPLFMGAGYTWVDVARSVHANSELSLAAATSRVKLASWELNELGTYKIEHSKGQSIHTFRVNLNQISYIDLGPGITIDNDTGIISSDTPFEIQKNTTRKLGSGDTALKEERYRFVLKSWASASVAPSVPAQPSAPILSSSPTISEWSEVRTSIQAQKAFIYHVIGRFNHPEVIKAYTLTAQERDTLKPLVTALSAGDTATAKTHMEILAKNPKFFQVATALLNKWDSVASALLTYTYGYGKKLDAKAILAKRTQGVIRAEQRLDKALSISGEDNEKALTQDTSAKKLSDIIPGQALTTAVYATPLGGIHQVNLYDASLQVLSTTRESYKPERSQVIDMIDKKGGANAIALEKQFQEFQKYIEQLWAKNEKITKTNYITYLKEGNISIFEIPGLSASKPTQVKEFRAYIAGSECINKGYVIGYPLFSFAGAPAQTIPVTPELWGASLVGDILASHETIVTSGAVGVNPVAAVLWNQTPEPQNGRVTTQWGATTGSISSPTGTASTAPVTFAPPTPNTIAGAIIAAPPAGLPSGLKFGSSVR